MKIVGMVGLNREKKAIEIRFFNDVAEGLNSILKVYKRCDLKQYEGSNRVSTFSSIGSKGEEIDYESLGLRAAMLFSQLLDIKWTVSPHMIVKCGKEFHLTVNFLLSWNG